MTKSEKRTVLKHTAVFAVANTVAQGVGVINSIALRRFLGPMATGVWDILQVILGYCGYASFGTTKAMARDYPYYRGKGNPEKAEHLNDMTLTFSMVMSVIPAIILLGALILKWGEMENSFRIGLIFLVGFLFLQRFYDLIMTLLRSDKQFDLLSQLVIVNAIGGLAATVLFVSWGNIYGLFFGTVVLTLGCLFYMQKRHPYRFRFYWNNAELLRQLKLGLPLIAVSSLGQFLKSMDRIMIAKYLGFYDVGLYSIAMMAGNYMQDIPMKFSNVSYPNMLQKYGATDSASAIKGYLLKPAFIFSIFIPFLSGIVILLMPIIVRWFFPKFLPGIPAMNIYLMSLYFVLLNQVSYNFLLTLDKYLISIPITLMSIAMNIVLNMAFLAQGWGLSGVAAGTTISYIFRGIATFYYAMQFVKKPIEIWLDILKFSAIALSLFGGIFLIDYFIQAPSIYEESFLKLAVFFCICAPFIWILEKKTGVLKLLVEMIQKKKGVSPKPAVLVANENLVEQDLQS